MYIYILKDYMKKYLIIAVALASLWSCKKKDSFTSAPISDYYPLSVGKYITYDMDSTVLLPFASNFIIHHYQAKDSVSAQITDNLGRPAFRILRFIRTDATQPWTPNNTFMAVSADSILEFTEDNHRFLKLVLPIVNDFSWNGNRYLTSTPYGDDWASDFMADWQYVYQDVATPQTIGTTNFDNTITVFERADSTGLPIVPGVSLYAEQTNSIEKYAKGVGLVYKDFFHMEYQGGGTISLKGFGVRLTIIDHN
jgi:hypothetical protein